MYVKNSINEYVPFKRESKRTVIKLFPASERLVMVSNIPRRGTGKSLTFFTVCLLSSLNGTYKYVLT